MWILESFKKDLFFIMLPGLIVYLFLTLLVHGFNLHNTFLTNTTFILAMTVIDTGHVYTTGFRTWFYPEEVKSSKRYYLIPLLVLLVFYFWQYFNIPYLWSLILYAQMYHYIRQSFGILKWYEKMNQNFHKQTTYILYLSSLIPFIGLHFRSDFNPENYMSGGFFVYPNQQLLMLTYLMQFIIFSYWIFFEIKNYQKIKIFEKNRIYFIGLNMLLFSLSFSTILEEKYLVASFVTAHGFPYIFLIIKSVKKTRKSLGLNNFKLTALIFSVAIVFGFAEYIYEYNYINISDNYLDNNFFIVALIMTPLFSHYIIDAFIWRAKHREAHLIYAKD